MEAPADLKHKPLEFALASVAELSCSASSSSASSAPFAARFSVDSGVAELRVYPESEPNEAVLIDLRNAQLFKLSPIDSVCIYGGSETGKEESYSSGITIRFRKEEESKTFHCAFDQLKKEGVVLGALLISIYTFFFFREK